MSESNQNKLSQQVQLVVSDLDGTLLNAEHLLSEVTRETVQKLVDQGYQFMLATGRHYQDVRLIGQQLGVDMCLITSNGGRVHNQAGELLYENHMPANLVAEVLSISNDFAVHRNIYQQEKWLVEEPHEELLAIHHASGFAYEFRDFSQLDLNGIDKIYFTAEHEQLLILEAKLQTALGQSLNITFTSPEYLEIMNLGVSKGRALEMIMQQRGLASNQVLALGDGMNDKEMLTVAGFGVVMDNAADSVKDYLSNLPIAKSNSEDGVAEYLKKHLL